MASNFSVLKEQFRAITNTVFLELFDEFYASVGESGFNILFENPTKLTDNQIEDLRRVLIKYGVGVPETILDRQTVEEAAWLVMAEAVLRGPSAVV